MILQRFRRNVFSRTLLGNYCKSWQGAMQLNLLQWLSDIRAAYTFRACFDPKQENHNNGEPLS
ncbi:MAG: hypothetical protein A3H44_03020 [Gammaproteobacteria bacterium RIFCSPLOWO2_02_FULL_57_10]|nr:MAG: hypothetical protein A3H44_03020 [Gammaproteobacteria bacterium RIFCSPLOWO2_02_FULL_57_10]